MLGYHFKTKTPATDRTSSCGGTTSKPPATNRTSQCWGTTSRQRHRNQIIPLNAGALLRDQDTGNKSYILVLGHHFETKTPATNRTSSCWGTTSRPRHRQQIEHLSAGAPLRDQDTGNKSYILVLGQHLTMTPASNILVLGHHFETKTPATNRTSQCWGTTSRPRHRQQTAHLSEGAPLPRHRQQIVHLSAGAPLRDKDTENKSYILMLGHRSETQTPATNRTS